MLSCSQHTGWPGRARGQGIDINGRPHSLREPIDLRWLFSQLPDRTIHAPLPAGTVVGHVHLWIADLDAALAFYRDLIGFTPQHYRQRLAFADLSAGGTSSHRLAVNIWQGAGAPQRPAGTAGLRYFTLVLRSPDDPAAIVMRLEAARWPIERRGDDVEVQDPAGNRLLLATSSASPSSDRTIPS
jgi:catechol 2,3-dioxygenase